MFRDAKHVGLLANARQPSVEEISEFCRKARKTSVEGAVEDLARLGLVSSIQAFEAVLDLHVVIHCRRASHPALAIRKDACRGIGRRVVNEPASSSNDVAGPLSHVREQYPRD